MYFHPIYYLAPFCSLSLQVVTQIRGHIAGCSPPLPTTVRALHFYREKILALPSSTRVELCVCTINTRVSTSVSLTYSMLRLLQPLFCCHYVLQLCEYVSQAQNRCWLENWTQHVWYMPGIIKYMIWYTTGASPRRADARLGSAHARIYRGCMICIIRKSRLHMRQ